MATYPELHPLGPCEIWFGVASTYASLAKLADTYGDVTLRLDAPFVPIRVANEGETMQNGVFVGMTCEVECAFTELSYTELCTNLKYPGAVATSTDYVTFHNPVGIKMSDNLFSISIRPMISVNGVAGEEPVGVCDDACIYIPNVHWVPNTELKWNTTDQRVWAGRFVGLYRSATGYMARWGKAA